MSEDYRIPDPRFKLDASTPRTRIIKFDGNPLRIPSTLTPSLALIYVGLHPTTAETICTSFLQSQAVARESGVAHDSSLAEFAKSVLKKRAEEGLDTGADDETCEAYEAALRAMGAGERFIEKMCVPGGEHIMAARTASDWLLRNIDDWWMFLKWAESTQPVRS